MAKKETTTESPAHTYECGVCGHRMKADRQPVECPECEGLMQNISNPQE